MAREVITDIHGKEEYEKALKLSQVLFNGDIKELTSKEIEEVFKGVPTYETEPGKTLIDVLVESHAASSKREAREFINNGAISINGDAVKEENYLIDKSVAIDDKYIAIRRGKKKYYLIILK